MAPEAKIDEDEAAEMLRRGQTVRQVAHEFGVTTQAVYLAIRQGRLPRRAVDGGPLAERIGTDSKPPSTACAGGRPNSG